jgi:hypothetical protein
LGGEEYGSKEIFQTFMDKEIAKISVSCDELENAYIRAFLRSGAHTIRFIEQKSPAVGGEIRYAILRRGLPYIEDTLNF